MHLCHSISVTQEGFCSCCASAAVLTVDVHRWQHHGHLGSASFVVAGGRKEEVVLRTSRGERSPGVKTQLAPRPKN